MEKSLIYIFDGLLHRFDFLTNLATSEELSFINVPKIIGGEICLLAIINTYPQHEKAGIYDLYNLHSNQSTDPREISKDGDYIPVRSDAALLFEPGQEMMKISVLLLDDDLPEDDETFKVIG